MVSIVTTQKILEKLYLDDSVWGDIVSQTKCFYVQYESKWWEDDDLTPLMQLSNSQADIRNGEDIFKNFDKHPEVIAMYPSSVFILDIDENEAASLQRRFGVIVQSFKHLDDTILTSVSRKDIYTEKDDSDLGWDYVFNGVSDIPVNAVIINDRNLFSNDQVIKDKDGNVTQNRLSGVKNVGSILNAILPKTLEVPFHVLIVCDKAGIEKRLTVKNLITYLNDIKKELKKQLNIQYHIVMELLAVSSQSMLYENTHNRRILTNYALLTFDHKINAFDGKRSTATQRITINKLFSYEHLKEMSPFVKEYNRQLKNLREYKEYVKDTPSLSLAEHEFAKDGRDGLRFNKSEHRMIF